ncbi:mycothiol system anti-sigma-R factor [Nocardioides sp. ChNu-153]|uniref:mycothiol system anti-sigma-R factor n=1 Tax=unclassified Nocardioides TaxID=2615069 RepID=UPI002406D936|nr:MULTISPECIES: mycothiol system anti-sigma-R factor [unclassified Nocardioides]MDF9715423.1 mycothiol system anti-sigma-R factor [Nocardioides sp. ChNu-99]MDN7120586.1 mycothiol system anti-sigma-R factor [Nocardioides sp. ChNu-153]
MSDLQHDHAHDDGPGADGAKGVEGCADFLERIIYFLDNELDADDCSLVQAHLDECGPCLRKYDLERTVKAVVARSCRESAPDTLRQRVLLQIREVQIRITD